MWEGTFWQRDALLLLLEHPQRPLLDHVLGRPVLHLLHLVSVALELAVELLNLLVERIGSAVGLHASVGGWGWISRKQVAAVSFGGDRTAPYEGRAKATQL